MIYEIVFFKPEYPGPFTTRVLATSLGDAEKKWKDENNEGNDIQSIEVLASAETSSTLDRL